MNFLSIFLRGIALLPSLIQGVEALFGAKTGAQKKSAALAIVTAAINVTDAIAQKTILDAKGFSSGLGLVIDGVVACLNASIWHKGSTQSTTVAATAEAASTAATTQTAA